MPDASLPALHPWPERLARALARSNTAELAELLREPELDIFAPPAHAWLNACKQTKRDAFALLLPGLRALAPEWRERLLQAGLSAALMAGNAEAADALLDEGVDPSLALPWPRNINHGGQFLRTPQAAPEERRLALHICAHFGRAQLAQKLLARGAPVNALDASGAPALTRAIESGSFKCARALLRAGANPIPEPSSLLAALGPFEQRAPNLRAHPFFALCARMNLSGPAGPARQEHARFVDAFLSHAGTALNRLRFTLDGALVGPLCASAHFGADPDFLRALVAHGADPVEVDSKGSNALHHAALASRFDSALALLALGADPLALNALGLSALELVSRQGARIARDEDGAVFVRQARSAQERQALDQAIHEPQAPRPRKTP